MEIHPISDHISLIDILPPIPGFERFIGSYALRGDRVALVDPGPASSMGNLLRGLEELGVRPQEIAYIFLTHIHIDHAGGVGDLMEHAPQAKVVVHERGAPHLVDSTRLWEGSRQALRDLAEKYGPIKPIPPERVVVAQEGMRIGLGREVELEVLITPGHAPHHLCFLELGTKGLFAGEVAGVYVGSVGTLRPATPIPFRLDHILTSLDKVMRLAPEHIFYGHFGPADEASLRLARHREQLHLWAQTIQEAVEKGAGEEEILAQLLEGDPNLKGFNGLPPAQRERERYFLMNSIRGFVGYLERQKGSGGCNICD